VKRLLSPAPFILKGEGWYVTDYPSESRKKAREAEKPKTDGAAAKSEKADKPDKPAAGTGDSGSASSSSASSSPSAPAKTD